MSPGRTTPPQIDRPISVEEHAGNISVVLIFWVYSSLTLICWNILHIYCIALLQYQPTLASGQAAKKYHLVKANSKRT